MFIWTMHLISMEHFLSFNFIFALLSLLLFSESSIAVDTINSSRRITYRETIISAGGIFELGFFSPNNSGKYYVGIWYKVQPSKVVWVANRDYAMLRTSASLTIGPGGNIKILDGRVSYNVTNTLASIDCNATLLDSGNFIVRGHNSDILWQSFDHPTDTLLPGMKLGCDPSSGTNSSLVSWQSAEDPAPGNFSLELNSQSVEELIIKQHSKIYWKGSTRRFNFLYAPPYYSRSGRMARYVTLDENTTASSQIFLDVSGQLKLQSWEAAAERWYSLEASKCNNFDSCGAFSICNENVQIPCGCLPGFKSKLNDSWTQESGYSLTTNLTDNICERKTELQCSSNILSEKDGFKPISNVDFPSDHPPELAFQTIEECRSACLGNCTCLAYAFDEEHRLCLVWDDDLLHMKQLLESDSNGRNFYLKLAASELVTYDKNSSKIQIDKGNNRRLWIIVTLIISLILVTLCLIIFYARRKLKTKGEDLLLFDLDMSLKSDNLELTHSNKQGQSGKKEVKLPLFSFASVSAATDNFSASNKLGEGGFGPVYKGILLKGDEIAVKRLSKRSEQGWEELKNEASLIAKLQHKNLVRLLGCCIENDEKILIYEYMPNKSLDFFLFDSTKQKLLDWGARTRIIEGIAQGLLYLHQYSRLRIIHRDLKASNILLDRDMNPKISDFGMARIFEGNELQANTKRIVGTYGYMSPEYALEGLFSIKSDVFSFGVLLLEILSGKKNTGFYQTASLNLLGYAWDMWTSDRGLDLMDPALEETFSKHSPLRYVNIGLLCVQESAEDRPTMSDVVSMLINESAALPSPKQPAFSHVRSAANLKSSISKPEKCSVNNVTVSILEAR